MGTAREVNVKPHGYEIKMKMSMRVVMGQVRLLRIQANVTKRGDQAGWEKVFLQLDKLEQKGKVDWEGLHGAPIELREKLKAKDGHIPAMKEALKMTSTDSEAVWQRQATATEANAKTSLDMMAFVKALLDDESGALGVDEGRSAAAEAEEAVAREEKRLERDEKKSPAGGDDDEDDGD